MVLNRINKTFEDYIAFIVNVRSLEWFSLPVRTEIEVGKELDKANFAGAQAIIVSEMKKQEQYGT